jgi:hypothetical protein
VKQKSNKSRFWALLQQYGYEVDDGERRIPVGPGRRPITKDLHGIADLVCIPPAGCGQRGILYFQVAYDRHDHDLHLEALASEPEKFRKLKRFLDAGNHYQVGSYNRDAMQTKRITVVQAAGAKLIFADVEDPRQNAFKAYDWYVLEREAVGG